MNGRPPKRRLRSGGELQSGLVYYPLYREGADMRNRFTATGAMIPTAAVLAVLWLGMIRTAGQAPGFAPPRGPDGHPKLDGIWQALNTANWDIQDHSQRAGPTQLGAIASTPGGIGIVEGDEIPYQPWAAAKKKENFDHRWTADPEVKCYLPGVPRATYLPLPFQIVQGTNKIILTYEYAGAVRVLHLDKVPDSPVDTWMGHSVGRWDGDTLVVDVTSFNDQTWFDRAGNFHSDALHVVERYTPLGPNHLNYEATIEDQKVFTRSWKMSMPLYRRLDQRAQLVGFKCVEFSEELLYGHLRKKSKD